MRPVFGGQKFSALLLILSIAAFGVFWFFFMHEKKHEEIKREKRLASREHKELVESSQNQTFQKFNLTGFDDKGKKFWNLEGDAAKVDSGQTVFLDQNVTLKLKDDTVIRTDHVQWSQNGGVLTTDAKVYVDHLNAKITGIGAYGRLSENFIQLNRSIEMLINDTTKLTCIGPMKIYSKENKAIFYRKVKVVDERGVLTANRMDVYFDGNTKKVTQVFAIGNVVIERQGDTTRSKRAIYTLATGSIRLEGNPEVTIHKDSSALIDGPFRN